MDGLGGLRQAITVTTQTKTAKSNLKLMPKSEVTSVEMTFAHAA